MGTTTPPLRDYQRAGVDWLVSQLAKHRAVLLADEMGLGKTVQALHGATGQRWLIICPAGARRVWQQEIFRWLPRLEPFVHLIEPGGAIPIPDRLRDLLRPIILIVGYDELSNKSSRVAPVLLKAAWDCLILDEAHYLKNPSNRTIAIYGRRGQDHGVQARAKKVILLTGTPTPNHAGELYQHCRTFWPHVCPGNGSLWAFEDHFTKYRDTVFGRQVTGSKNQARLRDALKDVILRRRKAEVLTELPPLVLQDIPLGAGALVPKALFAAQLEHALAGVSDEDVLSILRNPNLQNPSAPVARVRQELGLSKTGPAIEWIRERLESTDKLLVFAWHHSVIEVLRQNLLEFKPSVITGETPPAARALEVAAFQADPAVRVFIGQILAAGTAITLTAASEVVIVEPSWTPGENVQAIGRAHRLGQRDSVLASFLYLPGTLDQRIMQVFRRKASEISQLTGDDPHAAGASDSRAHA